MAVLIKYALMAAGAVLWLGGLAEQFHSIATTATYLALSVLIVLAAML